MGCVTFSQSSLSLCLQSIISFLMPPHFDPLAGTLRDLLRLSSESFKCPSASCQITPPPKEPLFRVIHQRGPPLHPFACLTRTDSDWRQRIFRVFRLFARLRSLRMLVGAISASLLPVRSYLSLLDPISLPPRSYLSPNPLSLPLAGLLSGLLVTHAFT